MPLDHSLVGVEGPAQERTWTAKDTMLYALGVGAGTAELEFTTERGQRVLPTFAVLAAQAPRPQLGDFDPALLLHAEQGFELHRELPPAGGVRTRSTVTGIYDKGSGALVTIESRAVDPDSGELMIVTRSSVFIRGEGGFGGDRGPRDPWSPPDRAPDHRVTCSTRPEQALLYRLSGDLNPLHSDPEFAARAGFDRPILHGLCTYGVAGRALLHTVAGSDPGRFKAMSGRFSSPVFPGETLTVSIWVDGDEVLFRTTKDDGTVALDHGRATIT
ncbi:3-hydroxyacyl-thioester dehydratase HtdY [Nonomuraea antimicrobica]|uniref:3-hydroxyacyl-thioester dehydratase HtdY n=1 Tax=Nonomuraea antimicrobica TaxID=561173 RepID=A0ABP7AXJ5_9ACTN